jgi:hypothetical protein
MSVINSGSFAKALWPGVNAWYGKEYDEYPVEWDKLFDTLRLVVRLKKMSVSRLLVWLLSSLKAADFL